MDHVTTGGFSCVLLAAGVLLSGCGPREEPVEPVQEAAFAVAGALGATAADAVQLAELRRVTARFQRLDAAREAGWETEITPCWAHHAAGAMGYHYGNVGLLDAEVELLQPEVVMYEPLPGGHMRLVGMEYIVPLEAWAEAGHDLEDPEDVPHLLGQAYTRHPTLPIFKLHVWLWRQNPAGLYADWNPNVSCAHAASTEVF